MTSPGRPESATLQETLAVFDALGDPGTPLSTPEVAEELDCSRRTAFSKLEELAEEGRLETKKVGARARIWWRPVDVEVAEPSPGEAADDPDDGMESRLTAEVIEELLKTAPVAISVRDSDGETLLANDRAQDLLGASDRGMVPFQEEHAEWAVLDAEGARLGPDETPSGRVLATGEPVSERELVVEDPEGERTWFSVSSAPVFDEAGAIEYVVTTGQDITALKHQERRLERRKRDLQVELEEVLDRISGAVYALDDEWRFTHINDRAAEIFGHRSEELIGERLWDVFPDAIGGEFEDCLREAMAEQEPISFERHDESVEAWFEVHAYPSDTGLSVYFRDVTDRKRRERELERYETAIRNVNDGIYLTDADRRYTFVNDAYLNLMDMTREEVIGAHVSAVVGERRAEASWEVIQEMLDGDRDEAQVEGQHHGHSDRFVENSYSLLPLEDGEFAGTSGVVRDITDRKEYEQELRQYETLIEESTDVNSVLDPDGTVRYITPSVEHVLGYDRDELVGEDGFEYIHPDDREAALAEFAELVDDPDYRPTIEFRFRHADGSWVVMEARGRNLLDDRDIEGLVVYTRDVTERARSEEWLSSLNDLNELFQETVEDLIETDSQESVERVVCDRLVEGDLYESAWVGRFDQDAEAISPTTSAGLGSAAEADPVDHTPADVEAGPALEAAKSSAPQVEHDLPSHPAGGGLQSEAAENGSASVIALPITYRGTFYGVLVIHSTRETAFEEPERAILSRFGRVIAHVISGIERDHALTTEDVVEVELRIEGLTERMAASLADDGRVTFGRAVPRDDGRFVGYGRATADAFEMLEALPDHSPEIESVSIYDETAADSRFEAVFGEGSIVSTVAAENGRLDQAVLTADGYSIAVHLPPSADTRRLVESVEELYPDVELVAQRRTKREGRSVEPSTGDVLVDLTERQRNALETAYSAGFFEWPRERTGEEIAETMDISSPTLHQHLRAAQRKLLGSVFADEPDG